MTDTIGFTVRPFRMGDDKEAALKPLEEAAEVYGAWEAYRDSGEVVAPLMRMDLEDEIADCITACCNLAARYGIDLQAALDRVERHNRERGRY